MSMEKIKYKKNETNIRPPELDDDLIKQCREFLAVEVPSTNIVFADEFSSFMPLCEYNSIFSMQHPIQILTRTPDPNGVYHPGSRKKYKIDRVIPAMFRRVSTLNDLGPKVPALMNAFMNATSRPANPYDDRKATYAKAIAQAIQTADNKEGKIEAQRKKFRQEAIGLVTKGKTPKKDVKQEEQVEESTTGLIDWE